MLSSIEGGPRRWGRFNPAHYGLTVLLVAAAGLVRWGLDPLLGHDIPYGPFVVPLVISGFLFGAGPALLCTALGLVLGTVFGHGDPNTLTLISGAVLFVVTGQIVAIAMWALQKAQHRTAQSHQQVQAAHQHKDRFLAVLGHELRNPLNGIVVGTQYLASRGPGDPKVLQIAQMVDRQARHMQRLLDEMLDISRIQQGKVQLVWTEVVLQEAIGFCLEQQTGGLRSRGQTIRTHLPSEPVAVPGDQDRIIQILANLLTNASKYSGPHSHIDVHLSMSGEDAVVVVQDNGPGIPAHQLPVIFEPFMQVDATLSRADGGLGLGLPTVRALAELHGGQVLAHNAVAPAQGAVFTVRLPRRRTYPADEAAPRQEEPNAARAVLID